MDHLLARLQLLLIVVRSSLVLVGTEEMVSIGITEALLHIVGGDILQACFNIAVLISSLIGLVFKLLHMLKLGVLAELGKTYTNFCFPPAIKAWLCAERSTFSFWYSWFSLNLSL
jgi:hypothetical protein